MLQSLLSVAITALPPVVITAGPEMFCAVGGALFVRASIMLIHAARTEVGSKPEPQFWARQLLVAIPAAVTMAATSAFVVVLLRAPDEVRRPSDTRNAALLGLVLTIAMHIYGKLTPEDGHPHSKSTRTKSRPTSRREKAPACSRG